MKTILHGTIDGHEVVLGFSDRQPDPEATRVKVAPLLAAVPEVAQLAALNQRIADRRLQAQDEFAAVAGHQITDGVKTQNELNLWNQKVREAEVDTDVLHDQTLPLVEAIRLAYESLSREYAVYSPTGANEALVTDDVYDKMHALTEACPKFARITMEGEQVADHVGRKWWVQSGTSWSSGVVSKLAESKPVAGVWDDDLTADQRADINVKTEALRVSRLSTEARDAELAVMLDGLKATARQKAEDADMDKVAFDKQAWYDEQKARAVAKYGVTE